MDEQKIVDALTKYDGTQPSLEQTVSVLSSELGEDWTGLVFEKLGGLSVELKEKLNHVFNYYASLTAWQETQTYLTQTEPLNHAEVMERMPVLKHWLDFFGDAGQELYQQLENKVNQESENPVTDTESDTESDGIVENNLPNEKDSGSENETKVVTEKVEQPECDMNSPEAFAVLKAQKEIQLLDNLQAWLAARCHELKDIEAFAYPYYGLVVDMMRQVVKDIQTVIDSSDTTCAEVIYTGGIEALTRKKEAIESDIQIAVENCESTTTALIDKDMDLDKVKKTLGALDNSTEPEYLGPAPDGFEPMDQDVPLNEDQIKEQYQELEKTASDAPKDEILDNSPKNTSQNEKNGVQRKLSFSLKPKKTEG